MRGRTSKTQPLRMCVHGWMERVKQPAEATHGRRVHWGNKSSVWGGISRNWWLVNYQLVVIILVHQWSRLGCGLYCPPIPSPKHYDLPRCIGFLNQTMLGHLYENHHNLREGQRKEQERIISSHEIDLIRKLEQQNLGLLKKHSMSLTPTLPSLPNHSNKIL